MPISERLSGEPDREKNEPFLRAVRYEQERLAARTYFRVQEIVFKNDCDLSVYRFQLQGISHVAVLGLPPLPDIDASIQSAMTHGIPAALPPAVLTALLERRKQAKAVGPWVEGHYRPGRPMDTT